ncbi:MAG: DUF4388 domain-containing protein, partial [Myxococcota bacterium]
LGPGGEVWLTGLSSPRGGAAPLHRPDAVLDGAGIGALVYELAPLTRAGAVRGPLPSALDRLVRRSLGIGAPEQELEPAAMASGLDDVARTMGLAPLSAALLAESVTRAMQHDRARRDLTAADALPTLEPLFDAPTESLEPASPYSGEALPSGVSSSLLQQQTLPGDEFDEVEPAPVATPRLPAPPLRSVRGPLPPPIQFDEAAEAFHIAGAAPVGESRLAAPAPRSLLTDAPAEVPLSGARQPALSHQREEELVLLCMADDADLGLFGGRLVVEGFRVEHAADLPTASLRIGAEPPAAVILAIDMPGAAQLLTWAHKQEATAALPMFVTGDGDHEDAVAELLELGAEDFFERPVRMNVAIAKLRRAIERRPAPAAASPTAEGDLAQDPFAPANPITASFGQPTGVMGTLRQMAITEIVQSLELGRKSARLEIVPSQGERGQLGFFEGQVVFAQCGTASGEPAFYTLSRYTEGFFRIRYGEAPTERNIDQSTTYLLLEAMRRVDESAPADTSARPAVNDDTPTPFD